MPGAYPFCAVSGPQVGLSLAVPLHEPRLFRLAYDASRQALDAEFDLGLSPEAERLGCRADFRLFVYAHDPAWGFRDALERYYRLFPGYGERREPRGGIWILGFSPGTMACPWDFGMLFDEGGEVRAGYDGAHDILPFVYTEPWGKYEHFGDRPTPDRKPRYGEEAPLLTLDELKRVTLADIEAPPEQRDRHFGGAPRREIAQAIVNSAIERQDGTWVWRHWTDEWSPGNWISNITLNPAPALPEPNRASITCKYELDPAFETARSTGGELAGIYLDSISGFMGFYNDNFRREHWRYANIPLVASYTAKAPAQLHAFACYEFAEQVAERMRARGKLVMGNTFRPEMTWFCHLLDMIGAGETTFCGLANDQHYWYLRAYAYRKPVSWMDYSFVRATTSWQDKELGMHRCLFYAVHPGTAPFSNPSEYEPSRPLFRFYEPLIIWLDEAGWQPVTEARSDNDKVLVERYGPGQGKYRDLVFVAVRNPQKSTETARIAVSPRALGMAAADVVAAVRGGRLRGWALVGDTPVTLDWAADTKTVLFPVVLDPDRTEVVVLGTCEAIARLWLNEAQAWVERLAKEAGWLARQTGNLVSQGDFEQGLAGWGTEVPPAAHDSEISVDAQRPIAGKTSVRAVSTADNAFHALHQNVELPGGRTYTLHFRYRWQRPDGAQGQVIPRFGVKGPDGQWVYDQYIYFRDMEPTGEAVAEYQREFSVPSNHSTGFFQFLFQGDWGQVWIDDVGVTSREGLKEREEIDSLGKDAEKWAAAVRPALTADSAQALVRLAAAQEVIYRRLRTRAETLADPHYRRCMTLPLDGFAEALGRAVEVLTGVTVHAPTSPPFSDGAVGLPFTLDCVVRTEKDALSDFSASAGNSKVSPGTVKADKEMRLQLAVPMPAEKGFGWTDAIVEARFEWRGQSVWLPRRATVRLHPPVEVESAGPASPVLDQISLLVRSYAAEAGALRLRVLDASSGEEIALSSAPYEFAKPGVGETKVAVPEKLRPMLDSLALSGRPLGIVWEAELEGTPECSGTVQVPVVRGAACPKLPAAPHCDGRLDPGEWDAATRLEGFVTAQEGRSAARPTTVLLGHDGASFFIAFLCGGQPEPHSADRLRDGAVWEDDAVEVFLQPPSVSGYYHFVVNAAGQQYDARIENVFEASWDAQWEAATGRDGDGWVVEIKIPFSVLGGEPSGVWRVNFGREEVDTKTATCWAPVFGGFHSPARFGIVVF
ncbi:MAG: hypothetical protein N2512_00080 [Armatimonadetes bacterium]|nr:hypothetical protein [Armatimonadota bacterium]